MKACNRASSLDQLFPYIIVPVLTDDLLNDIEALLVSNGMQKTADHAKAVAKIGVQIADQYGLERSICELSAYLHDISAVVRADDMLGYAIESSWEIDISERKYPFLLHQMISRVIAELGFSITDERVLDAVECHTTLRADPSKYDMALFISDKLAWDQEGEPPYYSEVADALNRSLEEASLAYMDYIVDNNMILHPHKWFEEGVMCLQNSQKKDR